MTHHLTGGLPFDLVQQMAAETLPLSWILRRRRR
jgi:hypothetical protein